MVRVTLDFDVLIDLIDLDAPGRFKAEMQSLGLMASEGRLELTYPLTVLREIERGPDPDRRDRYRRALQEHPALTSVVAPPGVFRLNVSRLDDPASVLGSDRDAQLDVDIRAILIPGKGPWADDDLSVERPFSDVDNLLAHARAERDVFLTGNTKDFTSNRCRLLREGLGIVVLTPAELLEQLPGAA